MEDPQWDITVPESIQESCHCLLVVVGRETGRQPEIVAPRWNQARSTRKSSISPQDILGRVTVDDEVLNFLSRHGDINSCSPLRLNLETNPARVIDKHTISLRGHVEWDILIRQLRTGTTILVPHINRLPILNKRTEPFAQAVDFLAYTEIELREHVALLLGVDPVFVAVLLGALVCDVPD